MTINNDNTFFSDIKSDGLDTSNIPGMSRPINYDSDISKSYSNKLWIILFVIVLIGVAMILFLPRRSKLRTSADIPNIQAPTESMKTEHEMPKPNEILQNVTIYDRDDQKQNISDNNLSQDFKTMGINKNLNQNKKDGLNIYDKNKVSTVTPVVEKNIKTPVVKKPKQSNIVNNKKISNVKVKPILQKQSISKPALIETKTSVAGEVELSYATNKKDSSRKKGAWSVQIVSAVSEAAADNAWGKLVRKYPDILNGMEHKVLKTVIAGKTFYRLRIINLFDAKTATKICSQLKSNGENCFVAR